jgi:hypothetical protein
MTDTRQFTDLDGYPLKTLTLVDPQTTRLLPASTLTGALRSGNAA